MDNLYNFVKIKKVVFNHHNKVLVHVVVRKVGCVVPAAAKQENLKNRNSQGQAIKMSKQL